MKFFLLLVVSLTIFLAKSESYKFRRLIQCNNFVNEEGQKEVNKISNQNLNIIDQIKCKNWVHSLQITQKKNLRSEQSTIPQISLKRVLIEKSPQTNYNTYNSNGQQQQQTNYRLALFLSVIQAGTLTIINS